MPDGSEFQTAGAATLKPRDAKVVRTRGTDKRLAFAAQVTQAATSASVPAAASSASGRKRSYVSTSVPQQTKDIDPSKMKWLKFDGFSTVKCTQILAS